MQPLGIMLYGYSAGQADAIRRSFDRLFSATTIVISASGREDMKVLDILEQGPADRFEEQETRVLVFLGFTQEQIGQVLKDYPEIFCTREGDRLLENGNALAERFVRGEHKEGWVRMCDSQGGFKGIYQWDEVKKRYQPQKMFL